MVVVKCNIYKVSSLVERLGFQSSDKHESHCVCEECHIHSKFDDICGCLTCNKRLVQSTPIDFVKQCMVDAPHLSTIYSSLGRILYKQYPKFGIVELPEAAVRKSEVLSLFVKQNGGRYAKVDDLYILAIQVDPSNALAYSLLCRYYLETAPNMVVTLFGKEFTAGDLDNEARRLATITSQQQQSIKHSIIVPEGTTLFAPIGNSNTCNGTTRQNTHINTDEEQDNNNNKIYDNNSIHAIPPMNNKLSNVIKAEFIRHIIQITIHDSVAFWQPLKVKENAKELIQQWKQYTNKEDVSSSDLYFFYLPNEYGDNNSYPSSAADALMQTLSVIIHTLGGGEEEHPLSTDKMITLFHQCEEVLQLIRSLQDRDHILFKRIQSRALLLRSYLLLAIDGHREVFCCVSQQQQQQSEEEIHSSSQAGKKQKKQKGSNKISPEEATEFLSTTLPTYLSDAKQCIIDYITGLTNASTIFDPLYFLLVALICRFEMKIGSVEKDKKESVVYASAYELVRLLAQVHGEMKGFYPNLTHAWERLVVRELQWYEGIDCTRFANELPSLASASNHNDLLSDSMMDTEVEPTASASISQFSKFSKRGYFAKDEWKELQQLDPMGTEQVPSMTTLMEEFVGLEKVKKSILQLYRRVMLEKVRGNLTNLNHMALHFRFEGNPGTGKTHIARIFAQILTELGLRPGNDINEEKRLLKEVQTTFEQAQQTEDQAKVKELQEQLKEQQCKLLLEDCKKHKKWLEENRKAATVVLQATNNATTAITAYNNNNNNNNNSNNMSYGGYNNNKNDNANNSLVATQALQTASSTVDTIMKTFESQLEQVKEDLSKAQIAYDKQQQIASQQQITTQTAITISNNTKQNVQKVMKKNSIQRFVETSGGLLATKGPDYFDIMVQTLLLPAATGPPDTQEEFIPGGVIFIDEAHQLLTSTSPKGKDVIQRLIKYTEDNRDCLTFILAGYTKDMETLIDADPGLSSRFPKENLFHFEDYNAMELTSIFRTMLQSLGQNNNNSNDETTTSFCLSDDNLADVIGRRIARGRGKKGFANARAVRTLLHSSIMSRNAERVTKLMQMKKLLSTEELYALTTEDVLGIEPNPLTSRPYQELCQMIGLSSIKKEMSNIMKTLKQVWDADLTGDPCAPPQLNGLFVGPPGTGKTTVAKLYGHILKESGFLTSGEVVLKTPADFLGSVLGESEMKTKQILESCRGKVLIIDEAYALDQATSYHQAVLDTLVSDISPEGGGDMVVILVGYEDQIDEMIRKANPGLARRFAQKLHFESYTLHELRQIVKQRATSQRLIMSFAVAHRIAEILSVESKLRNFGNAGSAMMMVDKLKAFTIKRLESNNKNLPVDSDSMSMTKMMMEITLADVEAYCQVEEDEEARDHAMMVQTPAIQDFVNDLTSEWMLARCLKRPVPPLQHVVFVGPAGTGKTTAARMMARLLKRAGILPCSKTVEVSGESLVGEYVGQTQSRVKAKLDEALGGVLFIDEAHRLAPKAMGGGGFKEEALGVLIGSMTNPIYQDKLLIVLAGYTDEIDYLLNTDQGLKRRFAKRVVFPNLSPATAEQILLEKLRQESFAFTDINLFCGSHGLIQSFFKELMERPGFGNIGDVEIVCKELFIAASSRLRAQAQEDYDNNNSNNSKEYGEDLVAHQMKVFTQWKRQYNEADFQMASEKLLRSRPKPPMHHVLDEKKATEKNGGDEEALYQSSHHIKRNPSSDHNMKMHTKLQEEHEHDDDADAVVMMEDEEDIRHKVTGNKRSREEEQSERKKHKRMLLNIFNDLIQAQFGAELATGNIVGYKAMMASGSSHPLYQQLQANAFEQFQGYLAAKDGAENTLSNLETLQQEVAQTLADMAMSIQENEDILSHDDQLYEQLMAGLVDLSELARTKGKMVLCGICMRANTPYSGCGYGGNSPSPIVMDIDVYNQRFL